MFDVDEFIASCRGIAAGFEPWTAARGILERALEDRSAVATALPATRAEIEVLHPGPEVVITKVVWGRGMSFPPHDHLTWACIGIYGGAERNTLYRVEDDGLVVSGGFELHEGDVGVMLDDEIHSVVNPRSTELSAAIHVYGGDFLELPRSNWMGDPPARVPAGIEYSKSLFEAANRSL